MKKGSAMHAVILAGGKGIRLRPYTTALPKPLVPIGEDHVILEILLKQLASQGFRSVTLCINHLGSLIRAYVGDGRQWGLDVDYVEETMPLSTVGPLFLIRERLPEHFIVVNGDILSDIRFDDVLLKHTLAHTPLTVATFACETTVEFGVLGITDGIIREFTEKPTVVHNVSMGIYAMARAAIGGYEAGTPCGVDRLILDLLATRRFPASYAFDGLWMDIGRPEDYDRANTSFELLREQLLPGPALPKVGAA
jgi:NDP-sugar pyrophosphorylase family protein